MRIYEGMFLLDDARCNDNFHAASHEVHSILEKNSAEIFLAEKWDERRLCYSIRGRNRAVYYLVYFTAPSGSLRDIERDCKLNDTVLRALILRDEQHEKLHKAGLLALRPGEPGEPAQSLSTRAQADRPAPEAPAERAPHAASSRPDRHPRGSSDSAHSSRKADDE